MIISVEVIFWMTGLHTTTMRYFWVGIMHRNESEK